MLWRVVFPLVLLAAPALAQSDAGVDDAGAADAGDVDAGEPDPCDPRCDDAVLVFCDGTAPTTLDCAALGASCGALSAAWGDDCLLSEGASCDPGYAFGESRCDRAASLYCIEGSCQVASGPEPQSPLSPSAGTGATSSTTTSSDPFGCSSCGAASVFGFTCFGGALRRRRRRPSRRA